MSGDIRPGGIGAQGLYSGATRFLSRMELRLGGRRPTLLSSDITGDDMLLNVDLSNADLQLGADDLALHSSFHVSRRKFLCENACYEEIQITNFSDREHALPLSFVFAADFADMFEIRGMPRRKRGVMRSPVIDGGRSVTLSYDGADGVRRGCRVSFAPWPTEITAEECHYLLKLKPKEKTLVYVSLDCLEGGSRPGEPKFFDDAIPRMETCYRERMATGCTVSSSSEGFSSWARRSKSDILLMTTESESGNYPYAGIPWFNTVFGRDGIITALQYLWVDPSLARGVLARLAKLQSKADVPHEDAEPGKILHEMRKGEMVDTGEVPFKKYYGSIDSTPLFIILAGEYLEATADLPFVRSLWPSIKAALVWIDEYGDRDGDGFIEYQRRSENGLVNQGWKDSVDSVSHAGGGLAQGSIALCEAQGYAYDAKIQAARISRRLGLGEFSTTLLEEAEELRSRFHERFWDPRKDILALALDGEKRPCQVLSSNMGHCLFSGIVDEALAPRIAAKLFSEEMYSGWGIRTLSSNEARYNPMSYHNGSIWPHDNAIIAEGFARYGLKDEVLRLAESIFDATMCVDLFRLPELFCGFPRRPAQGPTLYPVACSPQAWAAGSVFLLLKACLGLSIHGFDNLVSLHHPVLPRVIDKLWLRNLSVGSSRADLYFQRHGSEMSVYVEKRVGKMQVNILK